MHCKSPLLQDCFEKFCHAGTKTKENLPPCQEWLMSCGSIWPGRTCVARKGARTLREKERLLKLPETCPKVHFKVSYRTRPLNIETRPPALPLDVANVSQHTTNIRGAAGLYTMQGE